MPSKQLPPAPFGPREGNGDYECPACGAPYVFTEVPCRHFVGDWCFSADYDPGMARGQWATDEGQELLVAFDVSIRRLKDLLEYREWSSEAERDTVLATLPPHLRRITHDWGRLLRERIVAAPGYLGTHTVITESLASDEWDVHWAADGPAAAAAVEQLFRRDLASVESALTMAERLVVPE